MTTTPPDEGALGAPGETPEEQARSLRRVEEGGIPLGAERRLAELGGGAGAFTSDLSVGSFALCRRLGLSPLAQVMGSSIYQVGYQGAEWPRIGLGGQILMELRTLSQAWNEVRSLALGRLALEAQAVGADAVVGVSVRTGAYDWAASSIEYVAVGTAVRDESARAERAAPILTELSLADYAKLVQAGVRPAGVVAWTSVFFAAYAGGVFFRGGGVVNPTQNYEQSELTQAVYAAREQTMTNLGAQAGALGADGIVGVRIGHRVQKMEAGPGMGGQPAGMSITFDAIGTAVHDSAGAAPPEPLVTIDMGG